MSRQKKFFARGFTLIEAVVVIAITGIVAGMVALFIRLPVLGYVESEARVELSDAADTALRRMGRDLHLALPNSIRRATGANQTIYLEFLLTKTGGRYLAEDDNPNPGNPPLSFISTSNTSFTVVGPMPTGAQSIVPGDFIVVYNLGPGLDPANAYQDCAAAAGCNRAEVAGVSAPVVTLKSNPFAAQSSSTAAQIFASPGNQFQVIEPSPVTYVCDPVAQTLTRISGYAIQPGQPTDVASAPLAGATKALLVKGVTSCAFSYDNAANGLVSQRSALVGLSMTLSTSDAKESVTLFHQVHVDNTP
jgi:MSHA biogenesis protein MshO